MPAGENHEGEWWSYHSSDKHSHNSLRFRTFLPLQRGLWLLSVFTSNSVYYRWSKSHYWFSHYNDALRHELILGASSYIGSHNHCHFRSAGAGMDSSQAQIREQTEGIKVRTGLAWAGRGPRRRGGNGWRFAYSEGRNNWYVILHSFICSNTQSSNLIVSRYLPLQQHISENLCSSILSSIPLSRCFKIFKLRYVWSIKYSQYTLFKSRLVLPKQREVIKISTKRFNFSKDWSIERR